MSAPRTVAPKVRRFEVWIDCGHRDPILEVIELSEGASEAEIDRACRDTLDEMLANYDTGWRELEEGEAPRG